MKGVADPGAGRPGPPPLRPFGLVLHHDGSWTHEGVPLRNRKLRAVFDRSVRYLPEEDAFVVQLGRFRGQIEVEEAAFFVRLFDGDTGRVLLSDRSEEALDVATLETSPRDGALLCRVKRDLREGGIPARFAHAAQAQLWEALDDEADPPVLVIGGRRVSLPEL